VQGRGETKATVKWSVSVGKIIDVRAGNCSASRTVKLTLSLIMPLRSLWCAYRVEDIGEILSYTQKAKIKLFYHTSEIAVATLKALRGIS
jgi:hypothetical protein